MLRITGWQREEVIGEDWFSRFIPDSNAEMRELFLAAIKGGLVPSHHENSIQTRSGEFREILWNNTVLRDSGENATGVACIGEDITERRKAERALRSSEERFRQIADNIKEVFWMADVNMHQILYVSSAYASIWGEAARPLPVPGELARVVHPGDREAVQIAFERKRALGTYDETYRIVRPDGSMRWIRDRAYPVRDKEDRIYRFVGTAEDITDTKRLEEQFLRAQRLESIGMLAAGIAHDLNNVLAPVLMATPLLREHLTGAEDLQMLQRSKGAPGAARRL